MIIVNEERRQALVDRAMELWYIHGESYRSLLPRYYALREEMRKKKIPVKDGIPKCVLTSIPEVDFLNIRDRNEALRHLDGSSVASLKLIIAKIEDLSINYVYNTVKWRIADYAYRVKHYQDNRSGFGIDPDCRRMTATAKNHGG